MKVEINTKEAKALVRTFRLCASQATDNPAVEEIKIYKDALKTLEAAANRINRKLQKAGE